MSTFATFKVPKVANEPNVSFGMSHVCIMIRADLA